jgi:hypothetical protein
MTDSINLETSEDGVVPRGGMSPAEAFRPLPDNIVS